MSGERKDQAQWAPGKIVLLGSGETSTSGGQVFEMLARELPVPLRARVLETPAGFELNADRVAGRVADYLRVRLQNYQPDVQQIAARRKDPALTAQNPGVNRDLLDSDMIFLGPGSPSYTVRHLEGSLTWELIRARHRKGAAVVFASAAAIASGVLSLPVYEIFKVGEDPHWKPGLDFFAPFGLRLVVVSHWNNHDGGADLDTSHCFVGKSRFHSLMPQIAPEMTVVGLDEQTGLVLDLQRACCKVVGRGEVHLLRAGQEQTVAHGHEFPIHELGDFHLPRQPEEGIPAEVWAAVQASQAGSDGVVPEHVLRLLEQRKDARASRNWQLSDQLRGEIAALGFQVLDTPQGQQLERSERAISD